MNITVILLTAVGLSMDAFAVALASGSSVVGSRWRHALRLGAAFGAAQMLMPLVGWLLGVRLKNWIASVDHWIVFGLLVFIGLKMLKESFRAREEINVPFDRVDSGSWQGARSAPPREDVSDEQRRQGSEAAGQIDTVISSRALSPDGCVKKNEPMTGRRLFLLSLATSMDALAIGVTLALVDCPVLVSSMMIGAVTFVIAAAGAFIGAVCCCSWGRWAERLGAVILILIGVKILLEHLWIA